MNKTAQQKKGFSLIELLIAISIIAILSIIGLTVFSGIQRNARDAKRKADLILIKTALESVKASAGKYPQTAAVDNNGGWWISGSVGTGFVTLDQNYFPNNANSAPKDPISNGGQPCCDPNGYHYYYWSVGPCSTYPAGEFFVLMAQLENKNDKDIARNRGVKWCDGTTDIWNANGWGAAGTAFVVTSQ